MEDMQAGLSLHRQVVYIAGTATAAGVIGSEIRSGRYTMPVCSSASGGRCAVFFARNKAIQCSDCGGEVSLLLHDFTVLCVIT